MSTLLDAWDSGSGGATAPVSGVVDAAVLPAGASVDGGRYRIESVLGRGAFGITYAAEDTRLHRPVAVKELFPSWCMRVGRQVVAASIDGSADARFAHLRDRFVDEAAHLAQFAHAGIVRVYELIEEHGTDYVVMERLTGRSLARLLRQNGGRLRFPEAIRIADEIGAALAVVHQGELLHRDLKPDNIVITDDGRTVLIDFGAARQFVPDVSSTMTQMLTPGYAPLEQYSTRSCFGPATDVYGLAATLYRMLAGQAPPASTDRLHGAPLVPVAEVNRSVPPPASAAITHALALRAPERPQSVSSFLAELHGLGGGARRRPPAQIPAASLVDGWRRFAGHAQRAQREVSAAANRAVARLPWPRSVAVRPRPPTPVRAWLPVLLALAAVASVAPVHIAAAVAFVVLPGANAYRRTSDAYRRQRRVRGTRWHDPFTAPAMFVTEAGHAVAAVATEILEPLAITIAGLVVAIIGLVVLNHGVHPLAAVRVIAAAAVVGVIVALVRRLARHPRFSRAFAGDLIAPLVASDQRLSSAGRIAWAVAVGLAAFVVVTPLWPLG